ncbi:MAG: lipopolysaccharide heptosyltransferase II [Elusimicrobia bacterium]|nr:lipopolysaccharide heptosyltransferase II [Elusimicrobiota bacterium]
MKILIIRLSSIGDIVLATPLVRCLREKFPEAQIDFILKKEYSEILSNNPHISNLILFDGNISGCSKKISSERYDIVIDIHRNFRSFLLTLFSKARVLRYKNNLLKRLLLVEAGVNLYNNDMVSVPKRYLKTAEGLGVPDDGKGPDFFIDKEIDNKFSYLPENCIGICPVAVWKTKRWPAGNFIEFGKKKAAESDCEILIFGGKNDSEYCECIKDKIGKKARNLCGLSLQETASAVKRCRFLLTNDTGIMHIAEALKVPVVAVFGPTVEEFGFYPQSDKSKVISKKYLCKPCTTKGSDRCPVGDFKCMKEISIEEVFSASASCL